MLFDVQSLAIQYVSKHVAEEKRRASLQMSDSGSVHEVNPLHIKSESPTDERYHNNEADRQSLPHEIDCFRHNLKRWVVEFSEKRHNNILHTCGFIVREDIEHGHAVIGRILRKRRDQSSERPLWRRWFGSLDHDTLPIPDSDCVQGVIALEYTSE